MFNGVVVNVRGLQSKHTVPLSVFKVMLVLISQVLNLDFQLPQRENQRFTTPNPVQSERRSTESCRQ